MSYHAENNGYSHIRHHAANYSIQKNQQGQVIVLREKNTLQDFYNGFASVAGFVIAWGLIGLVAYALAKPYVQYFLGHNLL